MAQPELYGAMQRKLQAYVHIYDFLTDSAWEQLLNADVPRRDKIACLVNHSAKLGLQNASEPTLGILCALCHWTGWKNDPQAQITNSDFQSVKHEIRMALETCVSKSLCGPWLQQLPFEREAVVDMDDLVPCKIPPMELWQFFEKIPLRKNRNTEAGTLQAVHALQGLFVPSSGATAASGGLAPSSSSALLACLHVREGARFHQVPCLKNRSQCRRVSPQTNGMQSVPADLVNGGLPGIETHSKNDPSTKHSLASCDSPRPQAAAPAGPEVVNGSPSDPKKCLQEACGETQGQGLGQGGIQGRCECCEEASCW